MTLLRHDRWWMFGVLVWVCWVAWLLFGTPTHAFAQTNHQADVAAVKADLLARGLDLSGPCGAFQITGRVGHLPAVKAEGFGLIHSTGNGCTIDGEHYRADTLMLRDGRVWDLLSLSESNNGDVSDPAAFNLPIWEPRGPQPSEHWRAPFALDDAPTPEPTDPPVDPPTSGDLDAVLEILGDLQAQLLDQGKAILEQGRAIAAKIDALPPVVHPPSGNTFLDLLDYLFTTPGGIAIVTLLTGWLGTAAKKD